MSIFGSANISSVLKVSKGLGEPSVKDVDNRQSEFQQSVKEAFLQFDGNKLLQVKQLKNLLVVPGGSTFPHGLGRKWEGYIVTKINAANVITFLPSEDDQYFIRLDAASNTTIDIMVF